MAALGTTNISTTLVRNTLGENSNDVGLLCSSSLINKWGVDRIATQVIPNGTAADRLNSVQSSPYRLGDFRGYDHDAEPPGVYGEFTPLFNSNGGSNSCTFRVMGAYTVKRWVKDWGGSWVELANNNDSSWFNVTCTPDNHSVINDPVSGQVVGVTEATKNNAHVLTGTLNVTVDDWSETIINRYREYKVVVHHVDENDADLSSGHNEMVGRQSTVVASITPTPSAMEFYAQQDVTPAAQDLQVESVCSLGNTSIYVSKVDVSGHGTEWFNIDTPNITVGSTVTRAVSALRWNVSSGTREGRIQLQIRDITTQAVILTVNVGVVQTIIV